MLMELFFSVSFVLPGLSILMLTKARVSNVVERLALSYTLSLAIIFGLLYLGGITNAFGIASLLLLATQCASLIYLCTLFIMKIWSVRHQLKSTILSNYSPNRLIMVITLLFLLIVYMFVLPFRAILDSDVVHYYLPMAREIVVSNGFTYGTGYNYLILLKPIGAAVLYAWTYNVTGSCLTESFRLMPLVPIFIMAIMNYAIAYQATRSKAVSLVAAVVFLVFPFHDRLILYGAFYPDIFYYPLVFTAIYLLLRYSKTKRDTFLFWIGLTLGVAGLLKAQTIYLALAFFIVLFLSGVKHKKIAFALCCCTPFLILVPNFLAESFQREGLVLSLPNLTSIQLGLFLFLTVLAGTAFLLSIRSTNSTRHHSGLKITALVKKTAVLIIPFVLYSSLWYVNNLFRFGSLLYTSSANLPNYDWALDILESIPATSTTATLPEYLGYFLFMLFDPGVAGYVWLVPISIGFLYLVKARKKMFNAFLLCVSLIFVLIQAQVAYGIPVGGVSTYNPRDLVLFVPFLTVLISFGLVSLLSSIRNNEGGMKGLVIPLVFVVYYGLLSYTHSVLLWFLSQFSSSLIGSVAFFLVSGFGLTLAQTSFQLYAADRVSFVANHLGQMLAFSLVISAPFILLSFSRRFASTKWMRQVKTGLRAKPAGFAQKIGIGSISQRKKTYAKAIVGLSLISLVILIPRADMVGLKFPSTGSGFQGVTETQLEIYYGALYGLIANRGEDLTGGLLTYKAPQGLPYYLPGKLVVDLGVAANLAALKSCLSQSDFNDTVAELRQRGIDYMLFNIPYMQEIDDTLNNTLSLIIQNPELAVQSESFGPWKLFTLGPFTINRTPISLDIWEIHTPLTNASYNFEGNESLLFLQLNPSNSTSRVTLHTQNVSELVLSDFDFIKIRIEGSSNVRLLIRFFTSNGSSFDVVYWNDVLTCASTTFFLDPYFGETLRGDAYIGLISSDNAVATIQISEISFIKVLY